MSVSILKHMFTVDEYDQMGRSGIFSEDDRVELIEGEIIEMTPIGLRHAAGVARVGSIFFRLLDPTAIVWIQNPIRLSDNSEPEPDLTLLKPRADYYEQAHPTPADILLIVEVADTSFEFDTRVKVPLYAQHGILEVWVVDLDKKLIIRYRNPSPQGYTVIEQFHPGQTLSPLAFPECKIAVKDILG